MIDMEISDSEKNISLEKIRSDLINVLNDMGLGMENMQIAVKDDIMNIKISMNNSKV